MLDGTLVDPGHSVADGDLDGAGLEGVVDDLNLAFGGWPCAAAAAAAAGDTGERQDQERDGGVVGGTPGHPKKASRIR